MASIPKRRYTPAEYLAIERASRERHETEGYDRGEKFRQYEQIPSLLEYVLVEQDVAVVERFVREPGENWTRVVYQGLDAQLEISSIGVFVPLTAIYDRVLS